MREIPSGQDEPMFPARVANQNAGFLFSCPLAGSAIQQWVLNFQKAYLILKQVMIETAGQ